MLVRILIILFFLYFAITLPAFAQQAGDIKPDPFLDLKIDVTFTGGTIHQYLEAIEGGGGVANVILSEKAASLPLPAIRLKSITSHDAVYALAALQEVGGYLIDVRQSKNSPEILVITAFEERGRQKNHSKVFDIKALLEDFSIDDIVTAVQTAWSMQSENTAAELKFHKETNLLITVGSGDEVDAASNILRELHSQKSVDRNENLMVKLKKEKEILEKELVTLKIENLTLKKKIEELQAGKKKDF